MYILQFKQSIIHFNYNINQNLKITIFIFYTYICVYVNYNKYKYIIQDKSVNSVACGSNLSYLISISKLNSMHSN